MRRLSISAIGLVAFALTGCGGGLLDNKLGATQMAAVPVGNPLAMPPDLALPQPGETSDSYQSNGPVDLGLDEPAATANYARARAPLAPVAPQVDVYEKYGISKLNADGSEKSKAQLTKELKAALLAEKRKSNPNYGTIWNIGELFKE
jgi:hypothetical protein